MSIESLIAHYGLIAIVIGAAMGAGFDMALLCDLRIAADEAKIGEAYVNLALAGYEVAIDWPAGLGCGPTELPGLGSVELRFHSLQEDALLVDLDFPGGNPPFLTERIYRLGPDVMNLRQQFDGIVYLERSPQMTPLHRPSCQ